jgi:hypothetical protein
MKKVLVNQDGLTLNCTHQLPVYADDLNVFGGSVHTIQRNTEAYVVAIKGIRLEVNADKTNYTAMSRDQNAGRSHK